MKIKNMIALFEEHKPKTVRELKDLGFSVKRVGSGAFRSCFIIMQKHDVENCIVVKIPITKPGSTRGNLEHAQHEIATIRKINKQKRFTALRPFMPKILYADYRHGVIVMPYYYPVRETRGFIVSVVLGRVADAVFDDRNNEERDISPWNIRMNKCGEYKLIDLGLI